MELTYHNPWSHAPPLPLLRVRALHAVLRDSSNASLHWRRRWLGAPWSPHSGLGCRKVPLAADPWPLALAVAVAATSFQRLREFENPLVSGANGRLPVKGQAAETDRLGTGTVCLGTGTVCLCLQLVYLPLQTTDLVVLLMNYGSTACQHVLSKEWCTVLAY